MTHHPITKILVGVDFGPESDAAVAHAAAVARSTGAEIVLLHACTVPEPVPTIDPIPAGLAEYRARIEADLQVGEARLARTEASLRAEGLLCSHRLDDGFPDATLADVAKDIGAELTVVGSHGHTGLRWLLLGSVSQQVVRLTERDVLVARGQPTRGGYRKICVATDFTPSSERAIEAAIDLAHLGAEIDVVHFWHVPPQLGVYEPIRLTHGDEWTGPIGEELAARGEAMIEGHRRPGVELSFRAIYEPVVPGLLELLARERYDLVAMGSHGRRGLRRLVLGSVSEETARRGPCSVLVVHDRADAEDHAAVA
jgi:nucleotide-binding universal stress UspA family protein